MHVAICDRQVCIVTSLTQGMCKSDWHVFPDACWPFEHLSNNEPQNSRRPCGILFVTYWSYIVPQSAGNRIATYLAHIYSGWHYSINEFLISDLWNEPVVWNIRGSSFSLCPMDIVDYNELFRDVSSMTNLLILRKNYLYGISTIRLGFYSNFTPLCYFPDMMKW